MNKDTVVLLVAAVASALIASKVTSDHYEAEIAEYIQKVEQAEKDLINLKIEHDREIREKTRSIETQYYAELQQLKDEHEKTIADLHDSFAPSGVSNCPRGEDDLSRPSGDSTELVCYSESELRRKIEKSLAIATEADKLAVQYGAVLNILKE